MIYSPSSPRSVMSAREAKACACLQTDMQVRLAMREKISRMQEIVNEQTQGEFGAGHTGSLGAGTGGGGGGGVYISEVCFCGRAPGFPWDGAAYLRHPGPGRGVGISLWAGSCWEQKHLASRAGGLTCAGCARAFARALWCGARQANRGGPSTGRP